MDNIPDIRRVVSRLLVSVFALSLLAGSAGFYLLLYDQAIRTAEQEARMMLVATDSVSGYTESHILPIVTALDNGRFHREAVPFFAAHTVFQSVSDRARYYTFRNPTLNPSNPNDSPEPFDVEVIRRFRQSPELNEISGVRNTGQENLFYLARPIRITDQGCLTCHSTPERAPTGMVAQYGTTNGFGWTLGEIVGAQMLTVPLTEQLRDTLQLVAVLAAGLLLVFVVAYLSLWAPLTAKVVRPLLALRRSAEAASLTGAAPIHIPEGGVREIGELSVALERLRVSLAKALSAARGEGDALDEMVTQATAKSPDGRFSNAAAVAQALTKAEAVAGETQIANARINISAKARAAWPIVRAAWVSLLLPHWLRSWRVGLVAAGVLILGEGGVWFVSHHHVRPGDKPALEASVNNRVSPAEGSGETSKPPLLDQQARPATIEPQRDTASVAAPEPPSSAPSGTATQPSASAAPSGPPPSPHGTKPPRPGGDSSAAAETKTPGDSQAADGDGSAPLSSETPAKKDPALQGFSAGPYPGEPAYRTPLRRNNREHSSPCNPEMLKAGWRC
ncbi:MAG: DUF3365 domain-containing protein [Acetobacteraceae bacterium]|nr:DUF3365 domain-containing protein [Acetobacteraceae bacterium]